MMHDVQGTSCRLTTTYYITACKLLRPFKTTAVLQHMSIFLHCPQASDALSFLAVEPQNDPNYARLPCHLPFPPS